MEIDPIMLHDEPSINPLSFPKDINIDNWIFDAIKPFIIGRTLEIGSGNDALISCFLNNELPLHLSNNDRQKCESLFLKYNTNQLIRSVKKIDLERDNFEAAYAGMIGRFSTLFKLNTLNDQAINNIALKNAHLLLKKDGHLIVLVPANIASYATTEEDMGTIRSSNHSYIKRAIGQLFEIRKTQYLNLPPPPDGKLGQTGLYVIVMARKV